MRQVTGALKAHPWRSVAGIAVVVVAASAFMMRDLIGATLAEDKPIDYTLPRVLPLETQPGEVVYRIDANRSEVTVRVHEVLAGNDHEVALGTNGIAGDIGITDGDSSTARFSEMAVSVHQLRSDNALRDKVLQHEFLESHNHRTVNLIGAELTASTPGPGSDSAEVVIEGDLVVKGDSHPVRFEGTAALDGETLTATATAQMEMSELGVGPINKVGLVQTSNEIEVTLDLVAVDSRHFTPPTGLSLAAVDGEADLIASPSFSSEVQPVIQDNCVSCHSTGAVGAQMLTLDNAGQAAEVAEGLALVTRTGYMPPWPPSDEGVALAHPRGLDQAEVDLIGDWAEAGGQLDVPSSSKLTAPDAPEVVTPDADVALQLAEP